MSADNTETTSQNWFSRLGDAIGGIFIGLALFVLSFPLLFWNEGRSVSDYLGITQGKHEVISIKSDVVDPANEHKLVHLSGSVTTNDNVVDTDFGITKGSIRIERQAEIYQWEEHFEEKTEHNVGGSTTTTRTPKYVAVWSVMPVNSSSFKDQTKKNTGSLDYRSQTVQAQHVNLGAFTLPQELINRIPSSTVLPATLDKVKPEIKANWKPVDEYFYRGNSNSPQIGDQRIKFVMAMPQDISIYAQQVGNTFRTYKTSTGMKLERLKPGIIPADEMFDEAQSESDLLTWAIRFIGFGVMGVGIFLVFNPLVIMVDLLPFLGNFFAMGVGVLAALLAAILTLFTIAIAWIWYRPIIGLGLLVAAVFLFGVLLCLRKKKK